MLFRQKLIAAVVGVTVALTGLMPAALAAEIPDRLTPYIIIEYLDDNHYQILGYREAPKESAPQTPAVATNAASRAQEDAMIAEFKERTKDLPVYRLENPKPAAGMIVEYDGEGYIKDIRGDYAQPAPPETATPAVRVKNGAQDLPQAERQISITNAQYDDDFTSGMALNFWLYDPQSQQLQTSGLQALYDAQYPLGVVDAERQFLYFAGKDLAGRHADELLRYNWQNGELRQLTHSLFAINDIFPKDQRVYMVAMLPKEAGIKLLFYDQHTNETVIVDEDSADLWVDQFAYNYGNDKIYISRYSYSERAQNRQHANKTQTPQLAPNQQLLEYDADLKNARVVYSTVNKKISAIAALSDQLLLVKENDGHFNENPQYYLVSIANGSKRAITIDAFSDIAQFSAAGNSSEAIYVLGVPHDGRRGLYRYHLPTQTVTEIFVPTEGALNNFVLLQHEQD